MNDEGDSKLIYATINSSVADLNSSDDDEGEGEEQQQLTIQAKDLEEEPATDNRVQA